MFSKRIIKHSEEKMENIDERQMLKNKFLNQDLEIPNLDPNGKISHLKLSEVLSKNLVGFYFDAKWCLPGKEFLKNLKKVFNETKLKGVNFEIVHVSYDTDHQTNRNYYCTNHSNWLLWPFQKNITDELARFLSVKYLPCLIVISSNFKLITSTGRKEINDKDFDAVNYWDYVNKQANRKSVKFEDQAFI